jgi:hypothetical protein
VSETNPSALAKEEVNALKPTLFFYPQITQIHADFWDFLKIIFLWFFIDTLMK